MLDEPREDRESFGLTSEKRVPLEEWDDLLVK
jgi:hypothetical protein